MARPGVSYFDVAQAANAIQASNEYPTIDRVRQKLGTGSNSTIAAHLKQWKSEYMPQVSALDKTTIPSALIAPLQSLWEDLQVAAKTEFEALEINYQAEIDTLQSKAEAYRAEADTFGQQLQVQRDRQQALDRELDETRQKRRRVVAEKAELETHLLAEKSVSAAKDNNIATLREQLTNLTASLEHFRAAAQKQRDQESLQHAGKISLLEQKIVALQEQKSQDGARYQQALIAREREGFKVEKLALQSSQVSQQLEHANTELNRVGAELAQHQEALVLAEEKINQQQSALTTLQQALTKQTDRRHTAELENAGLNAELTKQSEEQAALICERDALQEQCNKLIAEASRIEIKNKPS